MVSPNPKPMTQVEQRMVDGLLALVAAERGGETVDRSLLSNLLRCFISLGTYMTAFQVHGHAAGCPLQWDVKQWGRCCSTCCAALSLCTCTTAFQMHISLLT